MSALVDQLTQLMLDFPRILSSPRHARPACRPLEGLGPRPPLRLDPIPTKIRGPFLPSLPSLPSICLARTSTLSRSAISSAVGMWPFGGRATVLEVLATMPTSSNSRRREAKALIVLTVIPVRPRETSPMFAKVSTPYLSNYSLERLSTGRYARQQFTGPMGSPCWTPLEQGIVLVSPESVRTNTSSGRVP